MAKAPNKKHKCNSEGNNISSGDIKVCNSKPKGTRSRKCVPRESPFQRSSKYRGVTRHRWTGRYEAHLWDKDTWNDTQKKKGRQVYLGAYDDEATAAKTYDLAALKYWGKDTPLNFSLSTYTDEMKEMEGLSREEYLSSLRRKSNGFSRGVSKYRGVARHHHNGRWEARIGRVLGNKYLYLGTFATQEEAATAYDIAAIQHRGLNAITNFDLSHYIDLQKPNNSCDNQSNIDHIKPTKLLEDTSASTTTTSSNESLGTYDDQIHVQFDDVIDIDEIMWTQPPITNSTSTLVNLNEYDELLLSYTNLSDDDKLSYNYVKPRDSSIDDIICTNGEDFFCDLNSLLCDFDDMEAQQVEMQMHETKS